MFACGREGLGTRVLAFDVRLEVLDLLKLMMIGFRTRTSTLLLIVSIKFSDFGKYKFCAYSF